MFERYVRIFKNAMRKACYGEGGKIKSLKKILITYRTTPLPSVGKSTSELLHGRQPRILLSLLAPNKDLKTHYGFNKFQENDPVFIKLYKPIERWSKGSIVKHIGRMMYVVKAGNRFCRCHQNHIRIRICGNFEDWSLSTSLKLAAENAIKNSTKPLSVKESRERISSKMTNNENTKHNNSCLSSQQETIVTSRENQPHTFIRRSGRIRNPPVRFVP